MKKQYFIYSVITCMLVIFDVKAQNTPIDDFFKKYPSVEGVTHVSMSQQMLKSIFTLPPTFNFSIPEAYSSVSVSRNDLPPNLSTDFKKMLLSSKYEQYMEMNKENSIILGYYLKKVNDECNEIVVLRHQNNQFSIIYIRGNIDIRRLEAYLLEIKKVMFTGIADISTSPNNQFAFAMPSFDDFKFPNFKEFDFKFDSDDFNFKMDEDFKLRMEESMKKAKEMMESGDFTLKMEESMKRMKDAFESEDFQLKINDSIKDLQKRIEDAQLQMEERLKQAEE